ncbi:MAG TPA: hypothetical protein DHN29_24720 [Cytophagales bacterium]|jgi:DNA-binding Lrp family transcriptional regulator|nr:hypothetical protein [Cytophagales bacterium]|tara:strand:- start:2197 stop:2679 length:483 start_codon:yes stop_codon:yes gene_type:complete
MVLTKNEKKILKYLLVHFDREFSINEIARGCNLSPNGAYKILKKFESEKILYHKKIANVRPYKINFDYWKTELILKLALMSDEQAEEATQLADACISSKNLLIIAHESRVSELKKNHPGCTTLAADNVSKNMDVVRKYVLGGEVTHGCTTIIDLFRNGSR